MNAEDVMPFAVALVVVGILYFKWVFSYWKGKRVYTSPTVIPFGNATKVFFGQKPFTLDLAEFYKQLKARGLPYGGYYFSVQKFFVPVDSDLVHNILVKDFQYFTDHFSYVNEETDPLTNNLFTQRGTKWKALRNKLSPAFSASKLKIMFQTLIDCTKHSPIVIDEAIEASMPIDMTETVARFTTDVMGSCAFGIECNCLKTPNTEFRRFGKRLFEVDLVRDFKRLLTLAAPRVLAALKIPVEDKTAEKFFINIVKETIELRDKFNVKRNDFMQLLLDLRDTDLKVELERPKSANDEQRCFYKNGFSVNEIAAQAFVFFVAGFESSSTTLSFLVYELAINLDIQEKLREEICEVLAKYDGKLTYDGINEMMYLDKCFQEGMRKYPPAGALPRMCTKPYKIPESDLVIEKDTPVMISVHGIHHDPQYYPEPEKFDPERFSEENKYERPPSTYLPFGEGPRICIGLRFGMLQTKVGLVTLLRNHRYRLNSKTKTPLAFEARQLILTAEGGVWVDAERVK